MFSPCLLVQQRYCKSDDCCHNLCHSTCAGRVQSAPGSWGRVTQYQSPLFILYFVKTKQYCNEYIDTLAQAFLLSRPRPTPPVAPLPCTVRVTRTLQRLTHPFVIYSEQEGPTKTARGALCQWCRGPGGHGWSLTQDPRTWGTWALPPPLRTDRQNQMRAFGVVLDRPLGNRAPRGALCQRRRAPWGHG